MRIEIGTERVGVFEADLPENVVVMQIGVSRFCRRTGALCRIGTVVPRAPSKMIKMLAVASQYIETTIEEKTYPAPGPIVRKLAPAARSVMMLTVYVVYHTVETGRSAAEFLTCLARKTFRLCKRSAKATARYVEQEFLDQPVLLVLTVISAMIVKILFTEGIW